jgi:hypothetical protein
MGADYVQYPLPLARLTGKRRSELMAVARSLTEEEVNQFIDCTCLDLADGASDERAGLLKALNKAFDDYRDLPGRRDTACIEIDARRFLVTGGMSWGDEPTDACSTFSLLNLNERIFELLNRWALADALATEEGRRRATHLVAELEAAINAHRRKP